MVFVQRNLKCNKYLTDSIKMYSCGNNGNNSTNSKIRTVVLIILVHVTLYIS